MKKFYLLSFILLFIVCKLSAQSSGITGKVTSEEGILIGATVLAKNVTTGTEKGAITDVNGAFTIEGLEAGTYTLEISYIGHKKRIIKDVEVTGSISTINVTLETDSLLDEVTVTARKRVESLYAVPMSISAISVNEMAEMNLGDMYDIGKAVPNFTVNNFGNGNLAHAGLFIRGIGVQDHWISTDPGVGAYLDGVYLGRQMGANLSLLNIKQVEVARGPQGSLFGRNSLGGSVNFITRKPDEDPYTKIQLKGGTLGRLAGDFYTSHKLGDKVGVSLSGAYNKRDGVGEFVLADRQLADVGEINQRSFRVATSIKPVEKLSFLASFDYSNDKYGQQPYYLELYEGSFLEAFTFDPDNDNSASLAESIQEATYEGWGTSLISEYEFSESTSLKLIASRRTGDYTGGLDLDSDITFTFPEVGSATQNSLELQLNSTFGKADLVSGLYYFDEEGKAISDFDFGGGNGRPLDGFQETQSMAVYSHLNYDLSEKFSASLGIRYTRDEKKANASMNIFDPNAAVTRAFGEEDWSALTWDFALNYQFADNQSVYGLVSRGYQNGGFPARAGFNPLEAFVPFDEQYATNYEIGYKGIPTSWLKVGLSGFYVNYTDLQLVFNEAVEEGFITITNNAGESRSLGAELDAVIQTPGVFSLTATAGYLDAEVTQVDDGVVATKEGDAPFFSPKLTASISPQLSFDFDDGSSYKFTFSYSYRSSMFGASLNNDQNKIESRALMSFNMAYAFSDPSWMIELYGLNLANEIYENAITDNAGIMANQVISSNDRREFGIKVIKTFGNF